MTKEQIITEQRLAVQKKQLEQKRQKLMKQAEAEILGAFKKVVLETYLMTFRQNYGSDFDEKSLQKAFTFTVKMEKDSIRPSFSFNENTIKFKSDFKYNLRQFNQNIKSNYDGRDLHLSLDLSSFSSLEEYDAFESDYFELQQIEQNFVPTSVEERYGTFNKITKNLGYTTTHESSKNATKAAMKTWNKIQDEVTANIFKKFKL